MRKLIWAISIAAAAAAGCGDDDGGGGTDAGTTGDGGGGAGVCAPGSGAVDLRGQWAIRANFTVDLTERSGALIRLCPNPQSTTASLVLKATMTGTGTTPSLQAQVCDITLPVASGAAGACPPDPVDNLEVSITLGPQLQTYLPTAMLSPATVTLSNDQAGATFVPSQFAFIAGAMLASPTDALPSWDAMRTGCTSSDLMADPTACVAGYDRVTDDDGDSHPGVTLRAMSGDLLMSLSGDAYVALRVSPMLNGTVRNAGCVEGTLDSTLDYSIVDSNINLGGARLATAAMITNIPTFDVRPTSTFKMLRADGTGVNDFDDDNDGSVTCAEIAAHASAFSR